MPASSLWGNEAPSPGGSFPFRVHFRVSVRRMRRAPLQGHHAHSRLQEKHNSCGAGIVHCGSPGCMVWVYGPQGSIVLKPWSSGTFSATFGLRKWIEKLPLPEQLAAVPLSCTGNSFSDNLPSHHSLPLVEGCIYNP